jgi:hypothetical protein
MMANWSAAASNDLMAFSSNHDLGQEIGQFQTDVENWADGLGAESNQTFPFGRYTVRVFATPGQINRIEPDM